MSGLSMWTTAYSVFTKNITYNGKNEEIVLNNTNRKKMFKMGGGGHFGGLAGHGGMIEDYNPNARLRLPRLLDYLKPYKARIAIIMIISFATIALSLAPPRIIGMVIDRGIDGKNLHVLYLLSVLLLIAYTGAACFNGLKGFILGKLGQKVTYDLWQDVYGNLQRLSFNFYDENQTGNIMSRVTNDVIAVEQLIVNGIDTMIVASLTLIGVAVILFYRNPKLALITMIPIPVLFLLVFLFTSRAHEIFRQVRRKMGEISGLLQDSISGIREIKSFAREDYEAERLAEKSSDYMQTNIRALKLWAIFFPAIVVTTSVGTFLVVLFGGKFAIQGTVIAGKTLSTGDIVSFLLYIGLFYQPVQQLNVVNRLMQHARAASERIFEVIDAVPQIREEPDAITLKKPIRGDVVFKDVCFSYKPGLEILHNINLEAKPGEIIALVGSTGAGKTTIISLIPRFYDAEKGTVLIDGIDVKKFKLKDLRKNIGIVMQEPFLFNTSIMENIGYGKEGASVEEITDAAKLANAHSFISALQDGYNHQIGERGVKLSVGEKQRIAIARAILKNPPVLILDEATSSVDNKTEALIQEALSHLLANRTSFVIAHRLSTVRHANRILVINNGEISESGTHDDLLKQGGIYKRLYEIQWRHEKKFFM